MRWERCIVEYPELRPGLDDAVVETDHGAQGNMNVLIYGHGPSRLIEDECVTKATITDHSDGTMTITGHSSWLRETVRCPDDDITIQVTPGV